MATAALVLGILAIITCWTVIGGVLLIGVINSALQLASVSSDVITIVTGVLLIFSVLYPRILAAATRRRASRATASK